MACPKSSSICSRRYYVLPRDEGTTAQLRKPQSSTCKKKRTIGLIRPLNPPLIPSILGRMTFEEYGRIHHVAGNPVDQRSFRDLWEKSNARADLDSLTGEYRICYIRTLKDKLRLAKIVG